MSLSPKYIIVKKLLSVGVPAKLLYEFQAGLVSFIKCNKSSEIAVASGILLSDHEFKQIVEDESESLPDGGTHYLRAILLEGLDWLQWLMFEGDPESVLKELSDISVDKRGVCGTVWGSNDVAYRCRTCEHDPTCAICVPCFQNGNHKDHDYSIIYTGGGCCDCGDETAWKREGFCSKHKGSEKIQPLPEKYASCICPALDTLLVYWKDVLFRAMYRDVDVGVDDYKVHMDMANEVTHVVVEMLLEFCDCSDSLFSFVSKRLSHPPLGLLDLFTRAENILIRGYVEILHELLLKFLAEPLFKFRFAEVFLDYYADVVKEAVQKMSDGSMKDHPMIAIFSVQIFTVPNLTPQLVEERNLLEMLLGCLMDIFTSCSGDDGRLQVGKWGNLYETTVRVLGDIKLTLSNEEVSQYVVNERPGILRTWIQLLVFAQGMDPQKRETHVHVEEESNNAMLPFLLGRLFTNIHSLFVNGAFSVSNIQKGNTAASPQQDSDDEDGVQHAKAGRISQETSVNYLRPSISSPHTLKYNEEKCKTTFCSSIIWILHECFRAVDNWLGNESIGKNLLKFSITGVKSGGSHNFLALKENASVIPDDEVIHKVRGSMVAGSCVMDFHPLKLLSWCEWPNITFDVSSQNVSMHIPLHRFVSLLLSRSLEKCYAEVSFANCQSSSLHSDFFENVLGSCHPYGFSAWVMEHPLQNMVLCSQIRTGMWRRNGVAVEILYAWYHAYQWGVQDLELDLFLLQCCAAVAPADLYVSRIIDRFGLSGYFSLCVDLPSAYEPVLVLGMLTLLIYIIQERRFCGQTTAECLRRVLICRLSVSDATRSQLLKFLPRELSKSDQFQEVLENVASYSGPSGLSQGMYKLRQHCWKELDLYYPRWSSKDLQIAEERYLRICRTSALVTQVPKWTRICSSFNGVALMATCPKMFHIIRSIIYYAVMNDEARTTWAPDAVLFAALHLLSLVLDCYVQNNIGALSSVHPTFTSLVCYSEVFGDEAGDGSSIPSLVSLLVFLIRERKNKVLPNSREGGNNDIYSLTEGLLKKFVEIDSGCMERLKILAPEVVHVKQPTIAEDSVGEKWKDKARARQAAMLEKMKAEQSKFLAGMKVASGESSAGEGTWKDDTGLDSQESRFDICALCHDPSSKSRMCYAVLLQKSRLLRIADRSPQYWDKAQQPDMSALFPTRSSTDQLKANTPSATLESVSSGDVGQRLVKECEFEKLEDDLYLAIHRDAKDVANALVDEQCLQELEHVNTNLLRMYLDALSREADRKFFSRFRSIPELSGGAFFVPAYDGFGPSDSDGVHLSSCGHTVHDSCLDLYLSSLRERLRSQILFEGGRIADLNKGEFLCPVCRRIANSMLPTLHGGSSKILTQSRRDNVILCPASGGSNFYFHHGLCLLKTGATKIGLEISSKSFPLQIDERITPDIEPFLHILREMYFMGKHDLFSEPTRLNPSLFLWDILKYSLMSLEIASRSTNTTLSPVYDQSFLYAGLKSSSGFILSLLLGLVRCIRFKNILHVIERYRGVVLFAQAVCLGVNTKCKADENMECILKKDKQDMQYPDIRFWKRAAAPVISYNPFCSLMWALFCLPHQFLESEDSFYSLVHLFYAVTVVQAIITCCNKYGQKIKDLEFHGSLISDIDNIIAENKIIHQYFVSVGIDSSCNVHENIRRLSFPYLRRCALLWKLLNTSMSARSSSVHGESSDRLAGILDKSDLTSELDEVEKLEKLFKIPALDTILKDDILRTQSLKWIQHFMKESETYEPKYRLFCTHVVPFQLVQLPYVYQELLERYIKLCCSECDPVLCLLCGKLCYDNPSPCCSENGCQEHATLCGGSFGVFLLIKKTTIFIQKTLYLIKWPSPYLDAFGEEDYQMERGKPLYLNEERYAVLTHLVVSHQLDQSSSIRG